MKSAHRHQLETNVLADWLGKQFGHLEPHKNAIALGAVALLVVGAIVVAVMSTANVGNAAQWTGFFSAFATRDPAPALEVYVDKADKTAAPTLWAKKILADQELAAGCRVMFGNRKEGMSKLEKAEGLYTTVIGATTEPSLKNSARLALARTYESMDKPAEARKFFDEVIADNKDSALAEAAKEGIKRLDDKRTLDALAWFKTQKPKLPANHPPLGGLPGLDGPLPDRPDLSFPGSLFNDDGTAKPVTPGTDLPPAPAPLGPKEGTTETPPKTEAPPPAEQPAEQK